MRQGAQGQGAGITLRDGMGREVGRGSGWGTHVHSWRIQVNVWQNHYNIGEGGGFRMGNTCMTVADSF